MRELTSFEIAFVTGGEKSLKDMTPSDFAPYAAAAGGAWFLCGVAATFTEGYNSWIVMGAKVVGGLTGLIAGWVIGKHSTAAVQSYM